MTQKQCLIFCVIAFSVFSGCAIAPTDEQAERQNIEKFRSAIIERRLEVAARFERMLRENKRDEILEPLAQYYLMTCQPKSALKKIKQMSGEKKELYEASLYALISTDRPASVDSAELKSRSSKKHRVPDESIRWAQSETWADEWASLSTGQKCSKMPLIKDAGLRNQAKIIARKKFETLPREVVVGDFNLLALTLDVGYEPVDPTELLQKYAAYKDNPYYRIIERQRGGGLALEANVLSQKDTDINLTVLAITEKEVTAHEIEVPILLR